MIDYASARGLEPGDVRRGTGEAHAIAINLLKNLLWNPLDITKNKHKSNRKLHLPDIQHVWRIQHGIRARD